MGGKLDNSKKGLIYCYPSRRGGVVGQEVPWLPLGEVGAGAGGSHGETEQREHWHWGGPRITDLSRVSEQLLSLLKIKEQGKVRAEGQGKVWA